MRKIERYLLVLALSGLYSAAQAAPINPTPHANEVSLMGAGGILDSHFGMGNLQSIDDDQMWAGLANVDVSVIAHHSAYTHSFGYLDASDNYVSLLSNISEGSGHSASFDAGNSGAPFRFGLHSHHEPLFSSAMNGNPDGGKDHMVSWRITGGEHAGDVIIAWEDLFNLGDSDYNDVVLRVSGVNQHQHQHQHQHGVSPVPVPPAVWLFISGLVGVVGIARRNRRRT